MLTYTLSFSIPCQRYEWRRADNNQLHYQSTRGSRTTLEALTTWVRFEDRALGDIVDSLTTRRPILGPLIVRGALIAHSEAVEAAGPYTYLVPPFGRWDHPYRHTVTFTRDHPPTCRNPYGDPCDEAAAHLTRDGICSHIIAAYIWAKNYQKGA